MGEGGEQLVDGRIDSAGAFEDLYRSASPRVFGYAARRVGRELAEDVTAHVFAEAWASRDRYDPAKGAPIAWLLGIATNVLRRHRRNEVAQLRVLARMSTDRPLVDVEEARLAAMTASERWPRVATALVSLADVDREILTLATWTDMSYAEMAEALDLSIGTVKSRLSRARTRLAAHVGELSEEGELI